jgi:hypothetical protein
MILLSLQMLTFVWSKYYYYYYYYRSCMLFILDAMMLVTVGGGGYRMLYGSGVRIRSYDKLIVSADPDTEL